MTSNSGCLLTYGGWERRAIADEQPPDIQWAGKVMATFKMQRVPSGSLLTRMSQAA